MQLLCLILLVEDFPAAVRFSAVEAATADASVDKCFCEQQDKLERSDLLAGTWFWLPEASCSLCLEESTKPPKPPLRSQIQMDNRLEEALLGAALLAAQLPCSGAAHASARVPELRPCPSGQRRSPFPLACLCPRNTLFLNAGQCFISLCHSSLEYSKQLRGGGAWFCA